MEPHEAESCHAFEVGIEAPELGVGRDPFVPDGYLGFQLRDFESNLWSMESGTWQIDDSNS